MMLHKNDATEIEHSSALELKFVDAGTAGEFSGHAAAYTVDSHRDVIRPGAFAATIAAHKAAGAMPPFLFSHDQSKPIGRINSMAEDQHGLAVGGRFNLGTSAGRDAHAHAKANDVSGLSIGFTVPPGGGSHARDGTRTLQRVNVHEVSLVALPSNTEARIRQVKMLATPDELESLLRDGGLSKRAAEAVAARGFSGLTTKSAPPQIDIERVADVLRRQSLELKNWK
jgi:HK97 family phage prohead protease